ncbi:MAG: hypothetical protein E7623_04795 [Ruminococcaceae bacterium]|nr:hypothetical protein [Oscillospiraceae bacterium]
MKEKKQISGKLKEMVLLLTLTVLFAVIYQIAMRSYIYYAVHLYSIGASILIVIFFFMNGGFSKDMPQRDRLPDEWDEEKKTSFLEKLAKRKKKARKLLFVIFPLLISLLIDCVVVFFF